MQGWGLQGWGELDAEEAEDGAQAAHDGGVGGEELLGFRGFEEDFAGMGVESGLVDEDVEQPAFFGREFDVWRGAGLARAGEGGAGFWRGLAGGDAVEEAG